MINQFGMFFLLMLFLALAPFISPAVSFQQNRQKYPVLYEIRLEYRTIIGITLLVCILFFILNGMGAEDKSLKQMIITGNILLVSAEIWVKVLHFWDSFRKYISRKGVSYTGKIIGYDVMTHQKVRGADWKEYIPIIQLEDGEVIKGYTSYLNSAPPVQSECIAVLYRKHYFITEIL